jgi:hypothetical protein
MTMQLSKGAAVSLVVSLMLVGFVNHDGHASSQACGQVVGTSALHDWPSLNCAHPVQTLTGRIGYVTRNDNTNPAVCPDQDGDWNIHLVPDNASSFLLRNSSNKANSTLKETVCGVTAAGIIGDIFGSADVADIEAEVLSSSAARGMDLESRFRPGLPVVARGYWVEDSGHEDKTELHPLTFLDADLGFGSSTVAIIQEDSSRFVTSGWDLIETYTRAFPRERLARQLQDGAAPQTLTTYGTAVLRETSLLDDTSHRLCSATFNTQHHRSQMTTWLSPNGVADFYLLMPPNDSWDCVDHALLVDYDAAEFTGLSETIDTKLRNVTWTDDAGIRRQGKSLETTVDLQLIAPPDDLATLNGSAGSNPLAYSVWRYQQTSGLDMKAKSYDEEQTTGHHVQLKLLYHPDLGATATSWSVDVAASTRSKGWSPALEPPAADGMSGPFRRDFVHDSRIYSITPSQFDLGIDEVAEPISLGNLTRSCKDRFEVRASTAPFINGVGLREIKWRVQPLKSSNGVAYSGTTTDIGLTGGLPVSSSFSDANVEVDRADGRHVTVSFKDLGWLSVQADTRIFDAPWSPNNHSVVELRAMGTSELGETVTLKTEALALPDCYGRGFQSPAAGSKMLQNAFKAYAAILKLEELGLLSPHDDWIRGNLTATQIAAARSSLPMYDAGKLAGHPAIVPRNDQGKLLQAALLRLSTDQSITAQQSAVLAAAVRLGDQLPTLRGLDLATRGLKSRGGSETNTARGRLIRVAATFDSAGNPDQRTALVLARIAASMRNSPSTRVSVLGLPYSLRDRSSRTQAAQRVSDVLQRLGIPANRIAVPAGATQPPGRNPAEFAYLSLRVE